MSHAGSSRVERLLSDAAHFIQNNVDTDPVLHDELRELFAAGLKPHVLRILNGFGSGTCCLIRLGEDSPE